ncbi:hypothetical protein CUMW_168700 [Citrus unshiu]|uniref:Uncharacterized protein n=1 Tax=Citrus unshiu TaxID=55188 RepID=A0A2H5PUL3_CITUN|nr:hypothetical protein CUMW_168700 [Citrus unshiu]
MPTATASKVKTGMLEGVGAVAWPADRFLSEAHLYLSPIMANMAREDKWDKTLQTKYMRQAQEQMRAIVSLFAFGK